MNIKYERAKEIVAKYEQKQLLKFYDELSKQEQESLLNQILSTDFDQIEELYAITKRPLEFKNDLIESMEYVEKEKLNKEEKEYFEAIGTQVIKQGKFAFATMAGRTAEQDLDIMHQKEHIVY